VNVSKRPSPSSMEKRKVSLLITVLDGVLGVQSLSVPLGLRQTILNMENYLSVISRKGLGGIYVTIQEADL
jgi:hypothetical protein